MNDDMTITPITPSPEMVEAAAQLFHARQHCMNSIAEALCLPSDVILGAVFSSDLIVDKLEN